MERDYDPEFDPHGHPIDNAEATLQHENTVVGSNDPSTCQSKVSKRSRGESSGSEWKMRAPVWEHYNVTKISGTKNEYRIICKYCLSANYKGNGRYSTSNAKRHINSCEAYKSFQTNNPSQPVDFDQRVFVRKFAEAIMYHSYPLRIVEHIKLREMLSYLNPKVRHVSRNTILRYCWLKHNRLKSFLRETLSEATSRISFTCDCWSACTTRGFLTLTAHYIDSKWNIKSHILNFRYFPPPHRGVDIYMFVIGLIKEWGLEKKALSITCDNAGAMNVMVARLKSDLLSFVTLPLHGRFFHVRCCAHILNLIVQSGMKVIDTSVLKLRQAVNYISGSDSCLCDFEKCVSESNSDFKGKKLRVDCPTRWNSTYLMLKRALEAKDALSLFAVLDTSYEFNRFILTPEEWTIVDYVCKFLQPFHTITEMFSGSDYPTANLYFASVVAIERFLVSGNKHQVESIQHMASAMMEKFDKYWGDHFTLLSIAIVLDPRCKMGVVRNGLSKLYIPEEVESRVKEVSDTLVEMYKFYDFGHTSTSTPSHARQSRDEFDVDSIYDDDLDSNCAIIGDAQSNVDAYLNSPRMPRNNDTSFDILKYWQSQAASFPVFSRMAKDILAVPITSVASESSFSMGGRVLTKYRSSLRTDNVEAFVTTQNWLFGYMKEEEMEGCFEVMKEVMPNDIDYDSLPREDDST